MVILEATLLATLTAVVWANPNLVGQSGTVVRDGEGGDLLGLIRETPTLFGTQPD